MSLLNFFKKKIKEHSFEDFIQSMEDKGASVSDISEESVEEDLSDLQLIPGELCDLTNEVLNTESKASVLKFKHNLDILMTEAHEKGKINSFKLIREDDALPYNWNWTINSHNTTMFPQCLHVSIALKKQLIIEKYHLEHEINGYVIPHSEDEIRKHFCELERDMGFVLLPSKFFSTKHFTINTALGKTGSYNNVKNDRDYIIIDDIDNFLNSGYAYSVAYRDAYLDVSHESMPISEKAVVLMREERYKELSKDKQIMEQLQNRKVILFKGDKDVAVEMVLTSMGVLPSTVGSAYANFDEKLVAILKTSIENLAKQNGLLFERSHGRNMSGDIKSGHFSDYYDDLNRDYVDYLRDFVGFMSQKFPEQSVYFNREFKLGDSFPEHAVKEIGVQNLLVAIDEYNNQALTLFEKRKEKYLKERENITPDMHKIFTETVNQINEFYKDGGIFNSVKEKNVIEDIICKFFHANSILEQLDAAELLATLRSLDNFELDESIQVVDENKASLKM